MLYRFVVLFFLCEYKQVLDFVRVALVYCLSVRYEQLFHSVTLLEDYDYSSVASPNIQITVFDFIFSACCIPGT